MTQPKYVRPAGSQSATNYKSNIDAMSKVFERFLGAFNAHQQDFGSPAPDMTVRVEGGPIVASYGSPADLVLVEIAAQTVSGFTVPSAGQHRVDRVVIDEDTGVASRVAGTSATGSPSATPPAIPSGSVPNCRILIQSTDTAITNSMITDERSFADLTRGMLVGCDGADFDATSGYLMRSGALSGVANGKKGIVSFWFRMDVDSMNGVVFQITGGSPEVEGLRLSYSQTTDDFSISGRQADGTGILGIGTTGNYTASATWRHFIASWDVGTPGARHIYVDDVEDTSVGTFTDGTLAYSLPQMFCGINSALTTPSRWNGGLAELYVNLDTYLDLTIEGNRRKFRGATGKPMHLGGRGEHPTGTVPAVYLHLDDGELATNFAINRGGGGDLAVVGSPAQIDTASTSPSD